MTELREPTDPRILFAAERTLLAWVRTGIAVMAFGFVVIRFGEQDLPFGAGVILTTLGAALNLIGAIEYRQIMRRLRLGDHTIPERPLQLAVAVALLLSAMGAAGVLYVLVTR